MASANVDSDVPLSNVHPLSILGESGHFAVATISNSIKLRVYPQDDLIKALGMTIDKTLGKGYSGDVLLLESPGRRLKFAMKRFPNGNVNALNQNMPGAYAAELDSARKLKNPHIIKDLVPMVCFKYLAICMEYYPYGDLQFHVGRLSHEQKHTFFIQLACAVRYLHKEKIIHRDIKTKNILLKEKNHIILSDFGLSCPAPPNSLVCGRIGTFSYMAPEVCQFPRTLQPYNGYLADSFSCGAVLWSMLMGVNPSHNIDLLDKLNKYVYDLNPYLWYSAAELLIQDPQKRKSITRMLSNLPYGGHYRDMINTL